MPTAINFFEVSGPDAGDLRRFYRDTLGLPVEKPDETGYAMIPPRDGMIGGGIWQASTGWPEAETTYAAAYVEVADVAATVAAAEAAGAKVVIGPREHGPTISAHLLDPAGNRIGVYQLVQTATP
jgi:uncharacterized protein